MKELPRKLKLGLLLKLKLDKLLRRLPRKKQGLKPRKLEDKLPTRLPGKKQRLKPRKLEDKPPGQKLKPLP